MIIYYVLIAVMVLAALWLGTSVRVVKQFERGVVFRFGQVRAGIRGPGLALITPIADRLQKVNMQIVTMPVPAQDGITRDNVTVRVDAVVYFRVIDPVRAIVDVQDYDSAIRRSRRPPCVDHRQERPDDLLVEPGATQSGLELMIDSPAVDWGVTSPASTSGRALPESMKRSMSRQPKRSGNARPGLTAEESCRPPRSCPRPPLP